MAEICLGALMLKIKAQNKLPDTHTHTPNKHVIKNKT